MAEPGGATQGVTTARGRGAVAASILAVVLAGGYFAASRAGARAPSRAYVIHAVVLVMAFWFPAVRTGSVGAVLGSWRPLVVWLAAWTLVWDLATAGLVGTRGVFQEWWLVYPAGVGVLFSLLLLHGAVTSRVGARGDG
jgi:hypothetical protein